MFQYKYIGGEPIKFVQNDKIIILKTNDIIETNNDSLSHSPLFKRLILEVCTDKKEKAKPDMTDFDNPTGNPDEITYQEVKDSKNVKRKKSTVKKVKSRTRRNKK
jgi:hypothetical protein